MNGWTQHLSDDQLIERLYGIRGTGDPHLEECPECASRWETIQERRGQITGDSPDGVVWSEQRRQILAQVEGGRGASWTWQRAWAPVCLMALALAVGVWFYGPVNPPPPPA